MTEASVVGAGAGAAAAAAAGARYGGLTAIVTGAGYGIGRACAERLAAEGGRIAVADIDPAAAGEVVESLGGEPHLALTMDVTDVQSVNKAVAGAAARFGRLDVLVNVAGGDSAHPRFEDSDDDVWWQLLDLNLLGVVRCCRAAVPLLRRSSHGPAIVTVSSLNAVTTFGSEPYSAAKAGITSLTMNLAASLAPDGIRVNAVAPGTIRTRVWDGQDGGADRLAPLYPLGRVGEPAEVAAAVAFLASRDAGWITGHTLPVDGGYLAAGPRP